MSDTASLKYSHHDKTAFTGVKILQIAGIFSWVSTFFFNALVSDRYSVSANTLKVLELLSGREKWHRNFSKFKSYENPST